MRVRMTLIVFLTAFVAVGLSAEQKSVVSAGRQASVAKPAPEYGTQDETAVRLTAVDFTTLTGDAYAWGTGISRYPLIGPLDASVRVPTGALITRLEFDYCDTSPTQHMTMFLVGCDNQGQNCSFLHPGLASQGDGCTWVSDSGLSIPINNYTNTYVLEVQFGATDGSNLLAGAIVSYRLQVSPAPGVATFGDVPTGHPQFQFIEALVSSGITVGCGGGNFCPNASLTRGQMAVFLSKALGLHWPN